MKRGPGGTHQAPSLSALFARTRSDSIWPGSRIPDFLEPVIHRLPPPPARIGSRGEFDFSDLLRCRPDGSLYILDLSVVVVVDANGEFITRIPAGGTVDYLSWSPIRVSAASNSSRKSFPRAHWTCPAGHRPIQTAWLNASSLSTNSDFSTTPT